VAGTDLPQAASIDCICGPGEQLFVLHGNDATRKLVRLYDGVAAPDFLPQGLPDGGLIAGAFDGRAYQVLCAAPAASHFDDLQLVEVALDGTVTPGATLATAAVGYGTLAAVSPGGGRTLFGWTDFVPLPDAGNDLPIVAVWIQALDGAPCASGAECLSGVCAASVCCSGCDAGMPGDAGSGSDGGSSMTDGGGMATDGGGIATDGGGIATDGGADGGAPGHDGGTDSERPLEVGCGCNHGGPVALLALAMLKVLRLGTPKHRPARKPHA
jgi:hypothetical protein